MSTYNQYSLEEKKAFIIGVLTELKSENEKMNELYNYFILNQNITEEECDEVYNAIENA